MRFKKNVWKKNLKQIIALGFWAAPPPPDLLLSQMKRFFFWIYRTYTSESWNFQDIAHLRARNNVILPWFSSFDFTKNSWKIKF